MVSGGLSLLFLLIAVILIVYASGRAKINAFVVLILIAFIYGLSIGMPAMDVIKAIKDGFGGTLANIGIVIIAGTIMGYILENRCCSFNDKGYT